MSAIDLSKIITSADKFEAAKTRKLAEINAAAEAFLVEASGKDKYTESEIDTWPTQQREAEVWFELSEHARDPSVVPWCAGAADERGVTLDEFMQRVQDKVNAYKVLSAKVIGRRQKLEDQITAATSFEELSAISWTPPSFD